ncbi:putative apyrase [Helianthus anomalus]
MEDWCTTFFGEDGNQRLQHDKFVQFLRDLHDEMIWLEFSLCKWDLVHIGNELGFLEQLKPGLSVHATNLKEVADSLLLLLEKEKRFFHKI